MEYRNLTQVHSLRLLAAIVIAVMLAGSQAQLHSQTLDSKAPSHVLIFKVNETCDDTVGLYQIQEGHFALRQLSKTPCALNMGFGGNFYCKTQTTLIERDGVSLLMGYHRDKLFTIQAAEQTVDGPYGSMRVSMRENAKLYDKWQTYTFHLKPNTVHAGTTILRFNSKFGVIGIEEINQRCEPIGKVQLIKVDGISLIQFAKQSNDKE